MYGNVAQAVLGNNQEKKPSFINIAFYSKWENWKKTQAMFYCKTSTNYNKWDMFESESDPDDKEEQEPIVPKDDP